MQGAIRPRHVAERIQEALSDTPVVAIVGPRQAGKSTLMASLTEASGAGWTTLTLDDLDVFEMASNDPAALVASTAGPLAIDEVQRAPDLLLAVKAAVDSDRGPGRFLLTGSADVFALPRLGDALAGRVEAVPLLPFSQGELEGQREDFAAWAFSNDSPPEVPTVADLMERVLRGGFPPALERGTEKRRRAWFDSYLGTSLQRDVLDVASITRITELPRLARMLAGRTARSVNLAELGRTAGLPATTLARYVAALRAMFLLDELPAWASNSTKRVARRPKLLLTDTGMASHLLDLSTSSWADRAESRGQMLETFVAMELRKQLSWSEVRATLHHYRTHQGSEVDVLLEAADGRVVAIEVKASHRVGTTTARHLADLRDELGKRFARGVVLHSGGTATPLGERIWGLPMSTLWTARSET